MNDRDKGIEMCSAKVEHLRNQLRMAGQNQQEVRNMGTNEIKNKSELLAELKTMRDEASQLVEKLDEKIAKYETEIDDDDMAAVDEMRALIGR